MVDLITDSHDWQAFVDSDVDSNFLHSWTWGEFQAELGKKVDRFGVWQDGDLRLVAQTYVEPARRARYLVVLGGPLGDINNEAVLIEYRDQLRALAKAHKCAFVRMRPQLADSPTARTKLQALGFRQSPMPLSVEHAGIIDLSKSEEDVLASASQSFRRKLRQAQKLGFEITANNDEALLEEFYRIHRDHARRQKYVPFSRNFIFKQFQAFAKHNNALLYTAKFDGKVVAQNFILFSKYEASYHYGVSTEQGVKLSAATILHLQAMQEARNRGCLRYNFWGIVDPDATSHRYYGVSQFKRSFGVEDLKHVPAHDLVEDNLRYKANWVLETVRKRRGKL